MTDVRHIPRFRGFNIYRKLLLKHLEQFRGGFLEVRDGSRIDCFGDPTNPLRATLLVDDPRFYRRTIMGGDLGFAESRLRGEWHTDDLTQLLRVFIRNLDAAGTHNIWTRLSGILPRLQHRLRRNTPRGSRRNIQDHYDLSNDFFQTFLDPSMTYSCGIFEHPQATMHEASLAKLDRVCRKLALQPSDHLVEIGSGWGGLAIHAAQHFGCRVTTTTISREQYDLASQRVASSGLGDRITVLCQDYRQLSGTYDKLVSIEMIEAVGHQFFAEYFQHCTRLLRPDGLMLLQGIVMQDQRYPAYIRDVDFIRKYIFPGGCLPSITALMTSITRNSDLRLLQLEDIGPHYARTLRAWQSEFWEQIDRIRTMGFPERFIRMWNYYFCYCEAAFEERCVNTVQMLLARPDCRLDVIAEQLPLGAQPNRAPSNEVLV